jgi:hypothetical protein
MTLAMIVSKFDFKFVGTTREDVDCDSDQFIMGVKGKNGVKALATHCAM